MRREVEEETYQTRCSELASLCSTPNRDARGVRSSVKESAERSVSAPVLLLFVLACLLAVIVDVYPQGRNDLDHAFLPLKTHDKQSLQR